MPTHSRHMIFNSLYSFPCWIFPSNSSMALFHLLSLLLWLFCTSQNVHIIIFSSCGGPPMSPCLPTFTPYLIHPHVAPFPLKSWLVLWLNFWPTKWLYECWGEGRRSLIASIWAMWTTPRTQPLCCDKSKARGEGTCSCSSWQPQLSF